MENIIYTQDPIYLKFLNEISDETFSENLLPIFDIKSKYSEMMQAYYEVGFSVRNINVCSETLWTGVHACVDALIYFLSDCGAADV